MSDFGTYRYQSLLFLFLILVLNGVWLMRETQRHDASRVDKPSDAWVGDCLRDDILFHMPKIPWGPADCIEIERLHTNSPGLRNHFNLSLIMVHPFHPDVFG